MQTAAAYHAGCSKFISKTSQWRHENMMNVSELSVSCTNSAKQPRQFARLFHDSPANQHFPGYRERKTHKLQRHLTASDT